MRFRQIYEKLNHVYSYSSLQFNFDNNIASSVINYGQIILRDSDLYIDINDDSYGREDNIHCTILYGIESASSNYTKLILNKVKPFSVELGKISFFEQDKFDVMKIEVISEELKELNKLLRSKLDFQNHYSEYSPHCTIAYINKETKDKLKFDENYFRGIKQDIYSVEFSSKDGSKELIKLKT